jgi:hypothetical protein
VGRRVSIKYTVQWLALCFPSMRKATMSAKTVCISVTNQDISKTWLTRARKETIVCLPKLGSRWLCSYSVKQFTKITLFLRSRVPMHLLDAAASCVNHFLRALAMVLWYHPRLISERLPARFRKGAQKNFSLPSSAVTSPTDVILWRWAPSILPQKIRTRHRSNKNNS